MVFKGIDKIFWPEASRGESRVFLWALCTEGRGWGEKGEREREREKQK